MVFTFHNEMAIDNLLEQLHFGHISKLVAKQRTLLLDSFTFQKFFFCMKAMKVNSSLFIIQFRNNAYIIGIIYPFVLIP